VVNNPVTMARRHVLGDLNYRFEPVHNVPVYLDNTAGPVLGFVDESLGKYADAITFHLADDVCKKLAMGHYTYSVDYEYADRTDARPASKRRLKLSSITLVSRKGYEKPVAKRTAEVTSESA
jgi:hypothetical protein